MSGKEAYSYEDEIDLYGDAEAPAEDSREQQQQDRYGEEKTHQESNDDKSGNTSSIPTFISEARGGTGVIPPRDESGRSGSGQQQDSSSSGGAGGSGGDGILPRRGDYGSPGQWSTKPISTVRPSDMPEEGLVAFCLALMPFRDFPPFPSFRPRTISFWRAHSPVLGFHSPPIVSDFDT